MDRKWWWITFWLAFLGTPVLALFGTRYVPYTMIQAFWLGPLIAGFALARLFTNTIPARIIATIIFSIGVLVIYFAIVFVGCLVASGGRGI